MRIEEARLVVGELKRFPPDKLLEAIKKTVSGAQSRRLEQQREEIVKKNQRRNEAIATAEKCMTIVAEIQGMLWYNGNAVDLDKEISCADFVMDVSCMLENYALVPQEVQDARP